jgi:hypothetical protein
MSVLKKNVFISIPASEHISLITIIRKLCIMACHGKTLSFAFLVKQL